MTAPPVSGPVFRPVGEAALLVEFGDRIDEEVNARVIALDTALRERPFDGMLETVPAYASVLVAFDPLIADHLSIEAYARGLAETVRETPCGREHVIPACYDASSGPDLEAISAQLGLAPEVIVEAHLAGSYRVYMCGFAPGYAYLGGVPPAIAIARKPAPVRGHPVGSIAVAGQQCLITTLPMPTGWWVIGRTDVAILRPEAPDPFLLKPGDRVRFCRQA